MKMERFHFWQKEKTFSFAFGKIRRFDKTGIKKATQKKQTTARTISK